MSKRPIWATAAAFLLAAPAAAFAAMPTSHITKAQAISEMRTDGYTNIQDVRQAKNGWTAKAMEGGKQVSLLYDGTTIRKH
jgi:hypothetical protein